MKRYIIIFPILSMILLSSPSVSALAVSDVELISHLNQQLHARIYLQNVDKSELSSLKIAVREIIDEGASQDMPTLRYEVMADTQGHYISITSEDVIREPILRFMLELNWSKGRLIREYALIIDPQ
jgi:pilus assembly protein FimV